MNQVTGVGTNFDQGGGAIAIIATTPANASPVTLSNLLVTQNSAPSAGGIAAVDANLTIEDSTILENNATGAIIGSAGGIGAVASGPGASLVIRNSSILSNTAVLQAGGIGAIDVDVNLSASVVDDNEAVSGRAGGIGIAGQNIGNNPTLTTDGVTVSNNRSGGDGGGIGVQSAELTLLNTTVSGNQSISGNGGGVVFLDASPASSVTFSTIASNLAPQGSNLAAQNSTVSFQGALFADGTAIALASSFVSLGNNLDQSGSLGLSGTEDIAGVDPLLGPLQDNGGPVSTHALLIGSPAIDAGPLDGPSTDARGAARPQDGDGVGGAAFDIGAFEAAPVLVSLIVDTTSDVDDDDFSAGNLSLREAVRLVNTGAVAGTTITFDNSVFGVPQTISLAGTQLDLTSSVEIVGPGQSLLTISGNDDSRIFGITGSSIFVTLSGLTLTSGFAQDSIDGNGGAIENVSANLTISDSTISGNRAEARGGGLSNAGGTISITNSTVTGNTGQTNGGGIFNYGSLDVTDSVIAGNNAAGVGIATGYGGGILNAGSLTLTRSTISGNTASEDGGGIATYGPTSIVDSVVSGNTATSFGGGIAGFNATLDLTRGTISDNVAGDSGGGIFNSEGLVSVRDSTISGNTAVDDGGGLFNYGGGRLSVTNSTLSGNTADRDGGGISNGETYAGPDNVLVISNSTLVANRSDANGDGLGTGGGISTVSAASSLTSLFNTIVAGNSRGAMGSESPNDLANQDVESVSAFNLIGDPNSSAGLVDGAAGNIVGAGGALLPLANVVDPVLADNGGPTLTHALVAGSPAIDAGDPAFAANAFVPALDFDQRGNGFDRVNDGDADTVSRVDIGAIEAATVSTIPRLTIADVVVNESVGTATIFVTLQDPASDSFTLSYTTVDGTADSTDDFLFGSGTLDFTGTQFEEVSFEIAILDDGIAEARESFLIELSIDNASEPLDVSDRGIVYIADDDEAVLFITDVQVDEASGQLTVDVELQGDTDDSFTVDLSTGSFTGEAVEGQDFTSALETLFFSGFDGEVQTFSVSINDDDIVEGDERFAIVADAILSNGSNVHFAGFSGRIDVIEIDQFTPVSAFSQAVALNATGDVAYLADLTGFYVIDVSDPVNPLQLGSYINALGSPYDVEVVGNLAYVLGEGLEVLDVSDPANITRLDQYIPAGLFISSFDVEGTNVYLGLTDSFGTDGGLAILDASNPASLTLLGEIALSQVSDVDVVGNVAYLARPFAGLGAYDVSNPTAITELGIANVGEPLVVTVEGATAFVGTSTGLSVWDVTDPTTMLPLGDYFTGNDVLSIDVDFNTVNGPVVYMTSANFNPLPAGTLDVLDISDFASIQPLGFFDGLSGAFDVLADGPFVYVADGDGGLVFLLADGTNVSDATILNDDFATLTIDDVTVEESAGFASVTVTLDKEVSGGFTFEYTTNDGSAVQGSDYTTTTGSFTSGRRGSSTPSQFRFWATSTPRWMKPSPSRSSTSCPLVTSRPLRSMPPTSRPSPSPKYARSIWRSPCRMIQIPCVPIPRSCTRSWLLTMARPMQRAWSPLTRCPQEHPFKSATSMVISREFPRSIPVRSLPMLVISPREPQ